MKLRKVYTKIWMDEWFANLSRASKLLFLYCITNENLGFSGLYECPDRQIMFDTGISTTELEESKKELFLKVRFHKSWIYVLNAERLDPIKGDNNPLLKAKDKELESCPDEIKRVLLAPNEPQPRPSEGSLGNGNGKGNKGGSVKGEGSSSLTDNIPLEVQQEIATHYRVPATLVGKYKDAYTLWVQEKPSDPKRQGRNMKATVMSWINRDLDSGKIKQSGPAPTSMAARLAELQEKGKHGTASGRDH